MVDQLVSMQLPKINFVMTDNGFKIAIIFQLDATLLIILMQYLLPLEVLVLQRDVDLLELPLLIQRHMARYLDDVENFR